MTLPAAHAEGGRPDLGALLARREALRRRIAEAGGDPARVAVVAVTKGFAAEVARAALDVGLVDLGENYAQELLAKAEVARSWPEQPRWHFVGAIQRNKVKALAPFVQLWHSVARAAEGEQIARWAPGARVLVQVDLVQRPGRNGCPPEDAPRLVAALSELGLDVRGLMTLGPQGPPEAARPAFRRLAAMARELGLAELSMGMTADLEVAVQEGATVVRVGEGLFGPRLASPGLRQ